MKGEVFDYLGHSEMMNFEPSLQESIIIFQADRIWISFREMYDQFKREKSIACLYSSNK